MSGTSADGIDLALVDFNHPQQPARLAAVFEIATMQGLKIDGDILECMDFSWLVYVF